MVLNRNSFILQIILFFILSLFLSALPLIISFTISKSSLLITILNAWYGLIPPIILLTISWLVYQSEMEKHWSLFVGRVWISVGIWFLLQYILMLTAPLNIFVKLLNLPGIFMGNSYFLLGTIIFIGGGAGLTFWGDSIPNLVSIKGNRKVFITSTTAFLVILLVIQPLFILISSGPSAASNISEEKVPTESKIFEWIEDVYNFGNRRPGSEADHQAIHYLAKKLREFGIPEVHIENYSGFDLWKAQSWSLTTNPGTKNAENLTSFYVPFTGPTTSEGISSKLVYVGSGEKENFDNIDMEGKIVLTDVYPYDISWNQISLFSYMAYDPNNTAEGFSHPYPEAWRDRFSEIYDHAKANDAAGLVGILHEYPDMEKKFTYYGYNTDEGFRSIPSLYVPENVGRILKEKVKENDLEIRLTLTAEVNRQGGWTGSVYGVLPGRNEDSNILISSHHDSPWRSGVEDSSGTGMVLSLAKYYSKIPKEKRSKSLVFLLSGTHFVPETENFDAYYNSKFIEQHRDDIFEKMFLNICLEHVAKTYHSSSGMSELPEPRGIFMTEYPPIVSTYSWLIHEYNLERTTVMPTGTPLGVDTDSINIADEGYPVASLISGPSWLYDNADTLDKVAKDQLVPITKMNIDFISQLNEKSDFLQKFNLNAYAIILIALLLTPLITLSTKSRMKRKQKSSAG